MGYLQVKQAATRATVAFLLANEGENDILQRFHDLLPGILNAVAESSVAQEDDTLLKCLVDLAENTPKYLRHQLEAVFNLCLKVCAMGAEATEALLLLHQKMNG